LDHPLKPQTGNVFLKTLACESVFPAEGIEDTSIGRTLLEGVELFRNLETVVDESLPKIGSKPAAKAKSPTSPKVVIPTSRSPLSVPARESSEESLSSLSKIHQPKVKVAQPLHRSSAFRPLTAPKIETTLKKNKITSALRPTTPPILKSKKV